MHIKDKERYMPQRQAKVIKKQQEKEREKAQAEAKIKLITLIDLDHINLKVKHPTLIKLKALKRVEG